MHHGYGIWIVGALALLALGAWIGMWMAREWKRWGIFRRLSRGHEGEEEAEEYLRENGFTILERQAPGHIQYEVDGRLETAELFADYIVEKDGMEYLVEVKTGEQAVQPGYAPTRRQLLEYALAFESPKLMLLDMDARESYGIRFPSLEEVGHPPPRSVWKWLILLFAMGLLCGLWIAWRRP